MDEVSSHVRLDRPFRLTARPLQRLLHLVLESRSWKGLGADSEEKREPVSDIDTAAADSLKVLDPERPIREADVSCACHWTVNVAAAKGHAKLYADVYSVAPSGVFVPADSPIKSPEDLAGVPIAVGYQSGSHYSTVQALEQYMPPERIVLNFADGMLFGRMDKLIEGKSSACALFSGPYYFAEQLGFRKIIDTTFMIASMINGDPDPEDLRKFFRALKRAQHHIDLRPELYTHHYKKEFPVLYHDRMDTRRWGPGERIVFEPYTAEDFNDAREWMVEHDIFPDGDLGTGDYEKSVVRLAT